MLKQQLQQKLQQRLSPQQIQTMRLLELNTLEFEERIKQELVENPALEEGNTPADSSPLEDSSDTESGKNETAEELLLGDYANEDDIPSYRLEADRSYIATAREEIPFSTGSSFHENLLYQLGLRPLTETDRQIATYIIGNIDDDGYLRRPLPAIADDLLFQIGIEATLPQLSRLLSLIQSFDPPGVGATTLQESLLLQLDRLENHPTLHIAHAILSDCFEAFTKKHYEKIESKLSITHAQLKSAIEQIRQLNPKPGNAWNEAENDFSQQILPDFIVEVQDGEIYLSLNNGNIPQLRISRVYAEMATDYAGNKANQTREKRDALVFIKQKLESANWFIESIRQRQQTLLRTMQTIIELQRAFFLTGDEQYLKPMILKDISEKTGYDISTISRTTNGKYVQTNTALLPLKYFFSESLQTQEGDNISTREIKRILQEHIAQEEKNKPLSDEKLCELLQENGYPIARRTVAKYREQMGIPVARLRKEL